ncbi:GrpB family protein [Dictyobacter vulcani]
MQATRISALVPLNGQIYIADYDPAWPAFFQREAVRIQAALGERILLLEHVGSTSVPGLAAKPRIDILLVVADSADEPSYVPALESRAYVLHIREPDWHEHRVFKGPDTDVNLHVFSPGCSEIDRRLLFRDWLRQHEADRQLYERTKRELARKNWKYTQNYADAKTAAVGEILARAQKSVLEH